MRIAFLHRSLSGGGTEADLRRMATGLVERGHALHVFTTDRAAPPPGVVAHLVPVLRAGRWARLVSFAVMAPRLAARGAFNVVVGFGRTPRQDVVRVGGGTHRSYLAAMDAAGHGRGRGLYQRTILDLERRMFAPGGHRRVLAVSQRAADEVIRDYGVAPGRVRVLYNGVDLERFHPRRRAIEGAAIRRTLGLGDRPVCLAVGTGFARKGFDLLLACWRAAPPAGAALVVAGDDQHLARWRHDAAAPPLAGHVHVLGPRDDVPALLAAADVLCLPSHQEAFGNVVLEAAAAGVPVVTSAAVAAAELFADAPLAAERVADPSDAAALGDAIARVVREDWPARSAAARAVAERHPWRRHLDELEAFFAEVARGD
jgi:UDP-glucose:(heptosyl)LPS alpha-1,3-glucosyltransferase